MSYDLWKTRSDRDEHGPVAARRDPTPGPPCPAVPESYDPHCVECGAECDVFQTVCDPCREFPLFKTGTEE